MSFKIADDPDTDYRALVKAAYDRCAIDYAAQRCTTAGAELNLITERLKPGSKILDVGCGGGIPVGRHLAGRFSLTGIDISSNMIELAKKNVPTGRFISADVMAMEFPSGTFDAIVSFYTIFHIPRQAHPDLFRRFARWLQPGGLLLVTLATKDDGPGYTEDDFLGGTMYWSHFGPSTYKRFLAETGFRLDQEGIAGGGPGKADAPEEVHPFFFAVRDGRL